MRSKSCADPRVCAWPPFRGDADSINLSMPELMCEWLPYSLLGLSQGDTWPPSLHQLLSALEATRLIRTIGRVFWFMTALQLRVPDIHAFPPWDDNCRPPSTFQRGAPHPKTPDSTIISRAIRAADTSYRPRFIARFIASNEQVLDTMERSDLH